MECQLAEEFLPPTTLSFYHNRDGMLHFEGTPRLGDLYFLANRIRHLDPHIVDYKEYGKRLVWDRQDEPGEIWYIPDWNTEFYRWIIRIIDGDLTRFGPYPIS